MARPATSVHLLKKIKRDGEWIFAAMRFTKNHNSEMATEPPLTSYAVRASQSQVSLIRSAKCG